MSSKPKRAKLDIPEPSEEVGTSEVEPEVTSEEISQFEIVSGQLPIFTTLLGFLPKKDWIKLTAVNHRLKSATENRISSRKVIDFNEFGFRTNRIGQATTKRVAVEFLARLQGGRFVRRTLEKIEGLPYLTVETVTKSFHNLTRLEIQINDDYDVGRLREYIPKCTQLGELSILTDVPHLQIGELISKPVATLKRLEMRGVYPQNCAFFSSSVYHLLPSLEHHTFCHYRSPVHFLSDVKVLQTHRSIKSIDLSQVDVRNDVTAWLLHEPKDSIDPKEFCELLLGFENLQHFTSPAVCWGHWYLIEQFFRNTCHLKSLRMVNGAMEMLLNTVQWLRGSLKTLELNTVQVDEYVMGNLWRTGQEPFRCLEELKITLRPYHTRNSNQIFDLINRFMPSLKKLTFCATAGSRRDKFDVCLLKDLEELSLGLTPANRHNPFYVFKTSPGFRRSIRFVEFNIIGNIGEKDVSWQNLAEEMVLPCPKLETVVVRGLPQQKSKELETLLRPFKGRISWF